MVTRAAPSPSRRSMTLAVPRPRRARRSVLAAAAVVLAVVAVAGCAGTSVHPGSGPTTSAVSPFAHIGAVPATVTGARFDPSTLTGKPVVLWFWAPWCTICRSEAPAVNKVAADFAGRVDIIGVAGQGTRAAMADFVKQTGTSGLTHLADVNGTVWREYGVSVQPSFAFITQDGRADLRVGSLDEKTLRARVAEVAAGAATSTVTLPPGQTCSRAPDGTLLCGSAGPTTTIPQPSGTSTP